MKRFQCIFVLALISATTLAFPNSWRANGDDDENPWRNSASIVPGRPRKSEFLGYDDEQSNWRNQRSLNLDLNKGPIYSYYERRKNKEKEKKFPDNDGKVFSWSDGDDGVISCPPDYPKCIPRLGR